MAKEYIERNVLDRELQDLVREYNHNCENDKSAGAFEALYRLRLTLAADVVEVVRCRDCKHFGKDMGYGKHDCKKYEMPYCLADDYCSYGERKDGVNNGASQEMR